MPTMESTTKEVTTTATPCTTGRPKKEEPAVEVHVNVDQEVDGTSAAGATLPDSKKKGGSDESGGAPSAASAGSPGMVVEYLSPAPAAAAPLPGQPPAPKDPAAAAGEATGVIAGAAVDGTAKGAAAAAKDGGKVGKGLGVETGKD